VKQDDDDDDDSDYDTLVQTNPDTLVHIMPDTLVQTKPDTLVQTKPDTLVHTKPDTLVQTKPNKPLGKLRYKIRYETKTQKLHATVVECMHLKMKDLMRKSDPYVRVYLLPGTHMELKSKIVKNNLNPVYNDEFSFMLSPDAVRKKTIVFQVYMPKMWYMDEGIGEIQIPLWLVDLDIETDNTMDLSAVTMGKDNKPVLIARRPPGDAGSISSRSSVTSLIGQGANAEGLIPEH